MTSFQKLKHEARRAEQRSDWALAIDLYQRALDADEDMADLSLYNRIGDLHLRRGDNDAAVEHYERAVECYADNAMHTSAIALCNKILRIAPGRTSIYRRLAVLHARTGLVVEGRGNMMAYVRHVLADGESEDATVAVAEFVELTGDEEVCLEYAAELSERGEGTAAAEQLRVAARLRTDRGDDTSDLRERIVELDPGGTVDADDPSPSSGEAEHEVRAEPARLASLVARQLADQGNEVAFDANTPPPAPSSPPLDDDLGDVRRQADRFRSRVADVLETGDPSIRYDLGVEFMTIGLLEEAIEEFRFAVADPRFLEAANARIGECLALRGSETSFEALRPGARASLGNGAPDVSTGDAGDVQVPEASEPPTSEPPTSEPPTSEPPTSEPPTAELDAAAEVPPSDPEDDEMQGHFFRARLAQYRIRRADERHKVDHAAHLDLGAAYIEMGLHQEALRELCVALGGPRPIPGRAVRALRELTLRLGDAPDLALEVIERLADSEQGPAAEALGSQLAEAWGDDHPLAGRLSELQARLGGSVDELPALEDMFPKLPETVSGGVGGADPGERTESVADSPAVPEEAPQSAGASVDQVLVRATELVGGGDVEGAVEHLQASLDRFDADHRTPREALLVLERLLELRPDDATLHEQRTELAMMTDDRDQLLAAFAGLGACLRRLGAAKRARAAYGRMLDVDPTNDLARQAIDRIDAADVEQELTSGQRNGVSAGEPESPAAEQDDSELEAMYDFLDGVEDADLEIVSGDSGGDVAPESAGDESENTAARSRYELGLAFRQMGMWEEALRELRPTVGLVTDRLGVLEAMGDCLLKVGRPAEAVTLLQSKLRSDEDAEQVGPLYVLGLALQAEGEDTEARDVFARIESAHPGYRDTADRLSELSL